MNPLIRGTSSMQSIGTVGDWAYLDDSNQPCRILEHHVVWGATSYQVWVPSAGTVLRVREDRLRPLSASGAAGDGHRLTYTAAAARIADALQRDSLVAPLGSSLTPLPHQIHALSRALSGDRVRYLLADEVGLGKTIEAGLVMKELKIRGLVRRTLVVAPAGLVLQWVQEMRTHFDEDFRLVVPGSFGAIRQVTGLGEDANIWQLHDQVVCPLDSVKPMESRRGWTREQTARYNRERFEDLVTAGWDLIVIDEAHRLGGSSEQASRYKLGEALAQASPYLLLLSATPHSGKTDVFRRLMSFIDADAFPDDDSVRQDRVAPYVIRTEKRRAIDTDGAPLFKPREVRLLMAGRVENAPPAPTADHGTERGTTMKYLLMMHAPRGTGTGTDPVSGDYEIFNWSPEDLQAHMLSPATAVGARAAQQRGYRL